MSLKDRYLAVFGRVEESYKALVEALEAGHEGQRQLALLSALELLGGSIKQLATCVDHPDTVYVARVISEAEDIATHVADLVQSILGDSAS